MMPNQKETDLIYLARAVYQLVQHSEPKEVAAYEQVVLEAASLFDDFDINVGTLHPDLGTNLVEFVQLKADENIATSEYEEHTRKMIEYLEKKYR